MIHTYDFIDPSTGEGEGSLARIQAARELRRTEVVPPDVFILYPQGYYKRKRAGGRMESLGKNHFLYVEKLPEFAKVNILQHEMSRTTLGDMLAGYQMLWRAHRCRKVHFYHVSDEKHLPRIRIFWWLTHPRGWTAEFHPATQHVRTGSDGWLYEIAAVVKNLPRLLPYVRNLFSRMTIEELNRAYR